MWHLRLHNLKLSRFKNVRFSSKYKTKSYLQATHGDADEPVDPLVQKWAPKLIFNSVIEKKVFTVGYQKPATTKLSSGDLVPLTLKYCYDDIKVDPEELPIEENIENAFVDFPYNRTHSVDTVPDSPPAPISPPSDRATEAFNEVQRRHELHKDIKNWMAAYDNYDDSQTEEVDPEMWKVNYGTPDPNTEISKVPCGGCGALLHCKDSAIPGYIPSEIYKNSFMPGGCNLESLVCQRCHFLKTYNLALQVQVTPEDYPKVLATVSQKRGLVVLMVDLLDFPCSIWPGIGEIFGRKTPVVVVGNKVDLLPQDSRHFLRNVRKTLLDYIKLQGFATFNIKDVALISAKTGYGVEDLITKLNSLYDLQGDVYIVGCTNVGKSTLFNIFLQSDYCKTQAVDLIQRATTSVWPGTTLNLLKFPIKRPVGYRQFLRHQRLRMMEKIEANERQLRKEQLRLTKNPKYATLIGHIDITREEPEEKNDDFTVHKALDSYKKFGLDETKMDYVYGKWCYDTPGVVQPDQIIHLLTTDELLLTLPKDLITPRSYCIKPKTAIFIAGLARLDYLEGPTSITATVFASKELPITICELEDAEDLYNELLGSDLFKVPTGGTERMAKWPKLEKSKEFEIIGKNFLESANDVVLSSSGWIALAGRGGGQYKFQAWTPEKRGVYVRDCLLPKAVALKGKRVNHSVAYHNHKFFL